jgi:hypothetical protein
LTLTSTNIGSATGSYSLSSGIYTVNCTGGSGIAGTSDGLYFANQPIAGNNEIIAYIATQSGMNAYATTGLMFSDLSSSYPISAQCAMVGVSAENGINFWYRTSDDTAANVTLGPSLTVPVWLRLTVNQSADQSVVQAFYSTDGISWILVGECTQTFPATYYSGLAIYSNVTGTTNTATISNFYQLTNLPQLTTGLLPNWTNLEVGGATGSFVANVGGSYTIAGTGNGFAGTSDQYDFAYQPARGNTTISAYFSAMTGTEEMAFCGLLVSDLSSTYPTAPTCLAIATTYSYYITEAWRFTDGTYCQFQYGPALYVPLWLRITVLSGSEPTITGWSSSDGVNWKGQFSQSISLPEVYYIGFIAGSYTTSQNVVTIGSASGVLNAFMTCWLRSDAFVTYSGSNVSFWADQSGQAYNASQSNSSNQPSLVVNSINGLPAINFNGTSSFMQFPTGFNNFAQGLSIFLVVKPTAATALSQIINLGTGSSNDYNFGIEINSSSEAEFFVYTSAGSGMTSVSYGSTIGTSAQLIEVIQTGTNATILTNGANPVTNASMNSIPEPTGRTANYLGQASGGGNYFNGEIAEVIIYNTALSTVQRQAVESYLISKFNL